jgi:hypothetical protein
LNSLFLILKIKKVDKLRQFLSYRSEKNQPHGQAHLVFADTQPNPKKQKELALTHHTQTE